MCCVFEYEDVIEGVIIVDVVEFGEYGSFETEIECLWFDDEEENEDYERNKDDDFY